MPLLLFFGFLLKINETVMNAKPLRYLGDGTFAKLAFGYLEYNKCNCHDMLLVASLEWLAVIRVTHGQP